MIQIHLSSDLINSLQCKYTIPPYLRPGSSTRPSSIYGKHWLYH